MDSADRGMLSLAVTFARIYRLAMRAADEESNKYLLAFEALDLLMRRRVSKDEITEKDYRAWKQREVFSGEKWRDSRQKVSSIFYRANREANRAVEARRVSVFADSANRTLFNFETGTGIETPIPLHTEETVKELVKEKPGKLPSRKVDRKRDIAWNDRNVDNAVTQSILAGESVQECAKRIAEVTGSTNEKAMLRYARTAMCGAQSAGKLESLEEQRAMGIDVQKQWIATLDGKTRDSHRHLDGQIKDLEEPFISLLGEIQFPGDPEAEAADIFNCRCAIKAYYPEYGGIVKRERRDNETRDIVGDVTYEEWKERKESRLTPELLHSQSIDQNPEDGFKRKPISKQLFNQITKPVVEAGGQVIVGGEEVIKHLMDMDAYSSQIGDILMFRPDATVSDVVEEVFHFWQERRGDYNDYPLEERIILREIDAKKHLIKVAKRYRIPSEETELTRRELEKYERDLQAWRETH